MSGRLLYVILAVCLCLVSSHTQGTARRSSLNRLVGQQPLLFGRRGINPNMNSLFFGKRASVVQPNLSELRAACGLLVSTYEQMALADASES